MICKNNFKWSVKSCFNLSIMNATVKVFCRERKQKNVRNTTADKLLITAAMEYDFNKEVNDQQNKIRNYLEAYQ